MFKCGNERFQGEHSVGITLLHPEVIIRALADHKARRVDFSLRKFDATHQAKTRVITTNHGTNSRATYVKGPSCKVFWFWGAYYQKKGLRVPFTMGSQQWLEDYERIKTRITYRGQVWKSNHSCQHSIWHLQNSRYDFESDTKSQGVGNVKAVFTTMSSFMSSSGETGCRQLIMVLSTSSLSN